MFCSVSPDFLYDSLVNGGGSITFPRSFGVRAEMHSIGRFDDFEFWIIMKSQKEVLHVFTESSHHPRMIGMKKNFYLFVFHIKKAHPSRRRRVRELACPLTWRELDCHFSTLPCSGLPHIDFV